jgi:sugar/nucleoside kinase (ribokinase family)
MKKCKTVILGSIGIDDIQTKTDNRKAILGGAASYACVASSFFTETGMISIVGEDFPKEYFEKYKKFGIDLEGLIVEKGGKTFRWGGTYDDNMIDRVTNFTELNTLEHFEPAVPTSYENAEYVLLGNLAPATQISVLDKMKNTKFVVADTMDLWINIAREDLMKLLEKIDMLMLNDSEARLLTGEHNIIKAASIISAMGPKYVVIKKGEHGAVLFEGDEIFIVPAYPVAQLVDPTGAGDSYAGAFIGYLASSDKANIQNIKTALYMGSVVASFGVERFSLERFEDLTVKDITNNFNGLKNMTQL